MNKFIFFLFSFFFILNIKAIALEADKIHKVVDGETLWGISSKYYNDGFKWGKIYNANSNIIKNPDLIFPGMEIKIPEIKEEIKPVISVNDKKNEVLNKTMEFSTQIVQPLQKDNSINISSSEIKAISAQKVTEISTLPIQNQDISEKENQEDIKVLDGLSLTENMPEGQISSPIMAKTILVNEVFFDGEILNKDVEDDFEKDSFINQGDRVFIKSYKNNFKVGDKLLIYQKGVNEDEKISAQYCGIVEILNISGDKITGKVIKIVNPIDKGMLVKRIEKK